MRLSIKIKGVSLVETILYISLFGIIFSGIMGFSLNIAELNRNANLRNNIERSAILLDEHITESFLVSDNIDRTVTEFNQDIGKIKIYKAGNSYLYYVYNGRMVIDRNGIQNYLTGSDLTVSKFLIEEVLSPTGSTTGVRISFDIRAANKANIIKSFRTYYSIK